MALISVYNHRIAVKTTRSGKSKAIRVFRRVELVQKGDGLVFDIDFVIFGILSWLEI